MLRKLTFIILAFTGIFAIRGEDTNQQIFDPAFRTLKVWNPDNFMSPPLMRLGTDDRIVVNFDEIGDAHSYLRYRLIHCNADWQPSQLVESEYLPSFNEESIDDYAYSSSTFIHYVNYRIEIPNERMRPLVSGNYLLQVYPEFEPDDVILQARFYVADPQVHVAGEATSRTDRGFNDIYQQLNLTIDTGDFQLRDPYNDLIVVAEQNSRLDSRRLVMHPQRVQGKRIIYEHLPELIFPAGNEYRRFETVRADYPGMNVDSVRYLGRNYHAFLHLDESRADKDYLFDQTQKGRFLVREYNSTDSDLGADYVTVHFTLDFPEVTDADIFVEGEMTNNRHDSFNRMTYNRELFRYELEMPLKQGAYNYQYVARHRKGGTKADPSLVEGNKHETKNEYLVLVYRREPGSRADDLIGFSTIYFEY